MPKKSIKEKFRELLGHGFVYGLSNSIVLLSPIFLIPVYTRVIEPADFGILALVLLTSSLFNVFFDLGISQAFYLFYYEQE